MKNYNKDVGEWLRKHREMKHMTQSQIAGRLGVTKTAVHYWESGKRMIFADTMINYCHILDIDPQDLVRDITGDNEYADLQR